jgi:hypothetical protein
MSEITHECGCKALSCPSCEKVIYSPDGLCPDCDLTVESLIAENAQLRRERNAAVGAAAGLHNEVERLRREAQERGKEREVVYIARCPVHGLHGDRRECFVCGGPVERVAHVEVAQERQPGGAS